MSTAARFLGVSAMAAVVAGWLWWRHNENPREPMVNTQTNEPTVVTPVVPPAVRPVVLPVAVIPTVVAEDTVVDLPSSPRQAPDGGTDAMVRRVADKAQRAFGQPFVEHLVSKGLSRADSERAVADVMPDWARCQIDATLAQADEQSFSRAAVLDVIDARGLFASPDGLDMSAAIVRAQPCRFSVQERLGIFPGEFGFGGAGQ